LLPSCRGSLTTMIGLSEPDRWSSTTQSSSP
jgi:hypothetical protein